MFWSGLQEVNLHFITGFFNNELDEFYKRYENWDMAKLAIEKAEAGKEYRCRFIDCSAAF